MKAKEVIKKVGKVFKAADYKKAAIKAVKEERYTDAFTAAEKYMDLKERPLSYEELKSMCGIHITLNHTGKMTGIISLSTYCGNNPHCEEHSHIKGSICEHCFAYSLTKCRTSMVQPLALNLAILRDYIIPVDLWPVLNVRFFRFESFGDLASKEQVINYFNFAKKNPETRFALWTKNPKYIKAALDAGHDKPENLVIVVSSLFLNVQLAKKLFPYADKVFTVYESIEEAEKAGVTINCGKRHCLTCGRCYNKNSDTYVNELLK